MTDFAAGLRNCQMTANAHFFGHACYREKKCVRQQLGSFYTNAEVKAIGESDWHLAGRRT